MPQQYKIGTHKTSILTEEGFTKVIYHNTPVVSFNQESIILNTGGWFSLTTKTRMNQTSNVFNLGFNVYQKAYSWFVSFKGQTLKFDGNKLTLKRTAEAI